MLEYALFERLPEWSQVEEINRSGILLAQRNYNGSTVKLYSMGDFFVERWSKNEIEIIGNFFRSAKTLGIFEPYLPNIEVERLIKS